MWRCLHISLGKLFHTSTQILPNCYSSLFQRRYTRICISEPKSDAPLADRTGLIRGKVVALSKSLLNFQWILISQLLLRVYDTDTYEEFIDTCLRNLTGLIDFDQGVSFQAKMVEGKPVLSHPLCMLRNGTYKDNSYYIENGYKPEWVKYFYCPWTSVFRYSDISDEDADWVESRIYQEVLHPQNLYYGLYCTMVQNGDVVGAIVLWRSKSKGDFSLEESYIMDCLKDHLALKLYRILSRPAPSSPRVQDRCETVSSLARRYSLTRREEEVLTQLMSGKDLDDIGKELFITVATLRKHISSIYHKADVHSRQQLMALVSPPTPPDR